MDYVDFIPGSTTTSYVTLGNLGNLYKLMFPHL